MAAPLHSPPIHSAAVIDGLEDLHALSHALAPHPDAPDSPVTTFDVVRALSTCPSVKSSLELQGMTSPTFEAIEAWLLSRGTVDKAQLASLAPSERRAALLMFHQVERSHCPVDVDEESECVRRTVMYKAAKLLLQAQMLMPKNNWVQQQLAIARVSVLLHSWLRREPYEGVDTHPYPRLQLDVSVSAHSGEGVIRPGSLVRVEMLLIREHAIQPEDSHAKTEDRAALEAYWNYLEGVKPPGTPNSLLAAQPLVVTNPSQKALPAEVTFIAPPAPGTYALRVHIMSASVAGVELEQDVEFAVV
ncbi:hypothetical protein AB1Y20_002336 [Prymnesium parvum]|uniref:Uncharacterized protein n=1 Tax=Prymnesium parvum TaxID=97485 RepID=A0AB34JAC9_PRYPA|mmetsp:Transcript_32772/g.79597  ORF Transcript_32772/g.79597 Transcript_32772/m.79597 type:complete len:303 (+) Transcript_32772:321-1229(+)